MVDWFRQWRLPLRKFLLGRVGVPAADIDDVAQEVFLRLVRYERAELIEQPQAYLFRMATNVAAALVLQRCH
jgi:DNA-directed RNA polymerase specialized sigma24 family protein